MWPQMRFWLPAGYSTLSFLHGRYLVRLKGSHSLVISVELTRLRSCETEAYAQRLSTTFVPCIQTLAHLSAFVSVKEANSVM